MDRPFRGLPPTTAPPARAPAALTDQAWAKFEKALDAVSEIDAQELLKVWRRSEGTVASVYKGDRIVPLYTDAFPTAGTCAPALSLPFRVGLVAHGQIQESFLVHHALSVGKGIETVPAMVGAHAALADAPKPRALVARWIRVSLTHPPPKDTRSFT